VSARAHTHTHTHAHIGSHTRMHKFHTYKRQSGTPLRRVSAQAHTRTHAHMRTHAHAHAQILHIFVCMSARLHAVVCFCSFLCALCAHVCKYLFATVECVYESRTSTRIYIHVYMFVCTYNCRSVRVFTYIQLLQYIFAYSCGCAQVFNPHIQTSHTHTHTNSYAIHVCLCIYLITPQF